VNILFELFNFQAATAQFTTLPQDELEALLAMQRDRKEKDELIQAYRTAPPARYVAVR